LIEHVTGRSSPGGEAQLSRISEARARLLPQVGAFITAVALLTCLAPPAHAQPDGGSDPAIGTTTLSLTDAGSATTLWFYGNTSQTTLSFPVAPGLRPATLNATLNLPFAMRSGTLSVTQDDRLVSKVALPLTDFAPVVIPLDSVEVVDDSATVTLKLTGLAEEGYCLDEENPVGLVNGSITYTGTVSPPSTVADFLPPVLRTVTIGLPDTPTQAESDTAVQLAAALQARYRAQAPQINVVPLPADATTVGGPAQPLERRIVVKEGAEEGLSLAGGDDPQLLISGPPDQLTNQARLLTDSSLDMAVSTSAVAGELRPEPAPPGDSATLAQLGTTNLSNIGVAPQVSIALDQTRFGHATQEFRLHLLGTHTPVPPEVGAQMTASVDGQIIDTWQAGADGNIDRWVDVPGRLVARYTSVVVGLDTSGYIGRCNDFRPITLTIAGSTVVESTPAAPPLSAGFAALPQALMPRMAVGINPDSFVDTARAVQIVLGLQRLSVVPLQTEVTSLQQAIDGDGPAVLVSADGWTDPSIQLPVRSDGQQLTLTGFDDDRETTLTLDPGIRFGSLQTVSEGQRPLLIATSNGVAAQLDELLRWLNDDPRGWSRLRGNAVVAIEGAEPQLVPGRNTLSVYGPPTATSTDDQEQGGEGVPTWWIAGGVVAAAAIGIAAYWLGTRRRATGGGSPGDSDSDRQA